MTITSESCLFVSGITSATCASWVQAGGSLLALVVAIAFPILYGRHLRNDARRGYFETIAYDVRIAAEQAHVYLASTVKVPSYRMPLHGKQTALPALLADGKLDAVDAGALTQFYVDATSFNYCLDLTQQMKADGAEWTKEVNRIRLKAQHLISGTKHSRIDPAMRVLGKHLKRESLERIAVDLQSEDAM